VDTGPLSADRQRPDPEVLRFLEDLCRFLLHDRAAFDDRYLVELYGLLPPDHPLRGVPGLALDLLDVVLRAVLSGESAEVTEAECRECGERCGLAGLTDDSFAATGRALVRVAREATGESWTASMSSGWAAVRVWVGAHLNLGAALARARTCGEVWSTFPELAPSAEPATVDLALSETAAEWALLERAAGFERHGRTE
jgi:hypothetical protein